MNAEIESIGHELEQAIITLRKSSARITPQGQATVRFLISSHAHPTADEIHQALSPSFPNISVAAIYNNLRVFKRIGIVKELTYGDASGRFGFNTRNHYRVICERCGKIVGFHYPQLDEIEQLTQRVTNFDVTRHRMEIYGLCEECKNKE